ncbi:MAG TPA: hypothetical protein VLE93_00495 [Candidatus Saccharimonadales bacterium]|nr:hypothetical protein [Candidatus Saccharimonadales bacterium]
MTKGGVAIHDEGFQIEELAGGAVTVGELRDLFGLYESATYIAINNAPQGASPKWKKKIELRYKPLDSKREGAMDVDAVINGLVSLPHNTLVGIYLWVNPDNDEGGWWRCNLVLSTWDQASLKNARRVKLPILHKKGIAAIPLLDLQSLGFSID